jgi:tripartite-type tricarboxylate transporter receptor subunit TctC
MKRRNALAAIATVVATPLTSFAQDKPPIRILVGFPPGGSADVVARALGDKLKSSLNQTVIVENKPGAAGRVALGEIRRAAPDGQTLILSPSGALVIAPYLFKNLGYDPVKDFAPIARVVTFDFAVTAGPGAPAGDLKAVLAWMKANPAKANYATPGAGTVPHFAGLLLAQTAGLAITHVAYKGGAPAVQDLLGGQVPLMIDTPVETIEHHRAGKLRILAVSGEARSRALPDVPTLREAGINMVADAFFGLYGPPGLPPDMATRLSNAVRDILRAPDMQDRIYALGLVPAYGNADELAATQATHFKRWDAPVKASGITPE